MISAVVDSIIRETPTVSTLFFKWEQAVRPGQFVMLWVPGVGEIPMSLSRIETEKSITVKNYGAVSDAILRMKEGDRFYFRGPYGNGFSNPGENNLLIGGGSGMASLRPLIDDSAFGIVSARSKSELLFVDLFRAEKIVAITDDGSSGLSGYPVEHLRNLNIDGYDKIYVCGPEIMLRTVYDFLYRTRPDAELSLERSMKCGIGVCDSCSIDGRQLCTEGPVFRAEEINPDGEFGRERLSHSGVRGKIP